MATGSDEQATTVRGRSIGLVLGAGGRPAHAFHSGALAALAEAGWDARGAELIIGTSAGAGVASLLRAGFSPADLYAQQVGLVLSAEGAALEAKRPAAARDSGSAAVRALPRPVSAALVLRGLLRWPIRPGVTIAGALPPGRRSSARMGDRHRALHDRWPPRSTWLCAVRVRDGRRVVFGRDDHPPVDIGTAVQAASAVPGLFAPVEVGGDDYVDGGVWSSTNADLTTGLGFDAVVVIAPQSSPRGWNAVVRNPSVHGASRAYHRAVLAEELRRVRHTATPVLAIEPTLEDLAVLTAAPAGGARDIAGQARRSVAALLERSPARLAELVEPVAV